MLLQSPGLGSHHPAKQTAWSKNTCQRDAQWCWAGRGGWLRLYEAEKYLDNLLLHKADSACILWQYFWMKKMSEKPLHSLSNPQLPSDCQTSLSAGSKPWHAKSAPARCTAPALKKLKRGKSTSLRE